MTFYGQADRKRFTAIEDQCTHNSSEPLFIPSYYVDIVDFWTFDTFLVLF